MEHKLHITKPFEAKTVAKKIKVLKNSALSRKTKKEKIKSRATAALQGNLNMVEKNVYQLHIIM
jgi:hypothetical protein